MTNKLTILFIVLLLVTPVMAMSETVDIFGTNATNAQSNITKSGNQSVNVSIWNIDNGIKTFKINVTNTSDTFTITIHNITAGMVVEQRFNTKSVNGYQADSTGTITFTQTQTTSNSTYDIRPAINVGGYNFTWAQFWTWPSLFGVNFTQYFIHEILNTSTVTVGRNANGSVELTAAAASSSLNTSIITNNFSVTTTTDYNIFASSAAGNLTITLPPIPTTGQAITVVKVDSTTKPVKIKPYYPFATATEFQATFPMNTGNDHYALWEATDNINVSAILFRPSSADPGTTDTLAIFNSGANGLPSTQLITSAVIPEGLDNYWTYVNLTTPLNYVLLNKSSRYWIKHTENTNGRRIWASADPTPAFYNAAWGNSTLTPIYVFANLTGISGYTGNTTGGPYGNSSLFYPSNINGTNQGNISNIYHRMNIITDGTNWYW